MTCERAQERLSAMVDGEVAREEAAALRAHAASCSACGAELAALERVHAALRKGFADHPFDAAFAARAARKAREVATAGEVGKSGTSDRASDRSSGRAPRARPEAPVSGSEAPRARVLGLPRPLVFAMAASGLLALGLAWGLLGGAAGDPERHAQPLTVASLPAGGAPGTVVIRDGMAGHAPSGSPFALRAGDRVRAEREAVALLLAGGGEAVLRSDTTLELRRDGIAITDGPGDVFVALPPRAAGAPPFAVEAPAGVRVEVLSTVFGVRFDGARLTVTCAEGRVSVHGAPVPQGGSRPSLGSLGAGEQLVIPVGSRGEEIVALASTRGRADLPRELGWAASSGSARAAGFAKGAPGMSGAAGKSGAGVNAADRSGAAGVNATTGAGGTSGSAAAGGSSGVGASSGASGTPAPAPAPGRPGAAPGGAGSGSSSSMGMDLPIGTTGGAKDEE